MGKLDLSRPLIIHQVFPFLEGLLRLFLLHPWWCVLHSVSQDASSNVVTYSYTSDAEYSDVVLERYNPATGAYLDNLFIVSPWSESFNLRSGTYTKQFGSGAHSIIVGYKFRLCIRPIPFRSNEVLANRV